MSKTIKFFYEISKIPRESGNERKIADYLCEFAQKRKLYYERDKYNNVIIKKKTSKVEPIILQAHMDMVCESNSDFDFKNNSITIIEEGGYLKAKGTTLGADNGIGVAQILNILDGDLKCNIEAIFTVEEETSMIGAENVNLSNVKSKQMINLDGFEENTIIIGSAGFSDIILKSNYKFTYIDSEKIYKMRLTGLQGGHSGFDIDKNRGNSSVILAEILKEIEGIRLIEFIGGTKFNVIPSNAECVFEVKDEEENLRNKINNLIENKKKLYRDLKISIEKLKKENEEIKVLDKAKSIEFLENISNFRHGVFAKNKRNEITTSINLGVVNLKKQIIKIGMRSSNKEGESKALEYIQEFSNENGFEFKIIGSQPGFETGEESNLVKKLKNTFEQIKKGSKLRVESVHAAVEAGFFKEKIKDLDVAIISPKILNAHTVRECVSIKSIEECDRWLEEMLK